MSAPIAERPPPPDLRLAGFAVGTWLSALAGLSAPVYATALVAILAAAAAVLLIGGRARDPLRGVAAAVLLGVCLGGTVTATRVVERDAGPLPALARSRATVQVRLDITDDPRALRGLSGRPTSYLVAVRLHEVRTDTLLVRGDARVLVLASDPGWQRLLPGQTVLAVGRLSPTRGGDLRVAVLSVSGAPTRVGRPPWPQRAAGRLRSGLRVACAGLPDEVAGLLPGLIVGDTSRLDPTLAADFITTGLTHLTAVSGSNCAIAVGAVLLLARWSRAGPRTAAAVSILALVGFVVLVRPSPSVLRAAAMGAVALVGLAGSRPRAALPALGASVTVLVVVDPELAASVGFALSVLATAGLLLLAPAWRDALRARRVPPGLAEALAVPAAAQVACAPVIAGLSGTVSLVAVPANLLAVPAVAPCTIVGVGATVVSPWWPDGARFLAWLGSWPARWLILVAHHGATAPSANLPWPGGTGGALLLAGLLAVGFVVGRRPLVRRVLLVAALAAVVAAVPVRLVAGGWPPTGWVVVACDVGQGDALVLAAGQQAAVVVDTGPDPTPVDRCLRRLDVRRVPLLILTHFHADHIGGLAGVLRGRPVGGVLTTTFGEPAAGRASVLAAAAARQVPVRPVPERWQATVGAVRLTTLDLPHPLSGTRSDPNNNSVVVRASVGRCTVLLAGDAEVEEQAALLATYGPAALQADVFKVAHHGSAFQDLAFLDAVRPGAALVSVGVDNGYGHPNGPVLGRLIRDGVRVLRTDRDGDVAVVVRGGHLAVVVRGSEPGRRPP